MEKEVKMTYEGNRNDHTTLICVFIWKGTEYRWPYYRMDYIAELFALPEPVREKILFWGKMLHDPD